MLVVATLSRRYNRPFTHDAFRPLILPAADCPYGFRRDLARWRQLVTPAWIAGLVAGDAVPAAPAGAWRLFEAGCGDGDAFAGGHVPGAGYLDTMQFEHGPLWNKVADAALLDALREHGIRHEVTVILYGRNVLAAARIAHLLLYAGVADVRLLDGGFAAWLHAGLPLADGGPRRWPAARDFGPAAPARPEYLFDMPQTHSLLAHGTGSLVSTRTWSEFVGTTSGYSYIPVRGEIPGALWGRAGDEGDVHSMSAFHTDGRMKPAQQIRAMWAASGIHPGRLCVFYCGTGWRASLAFFYAWLMGWSRIAVYDGGWCEWSSAEGNPILCRTVPAE
jgi:3-mercaptopyruvate sulfurtransferase SseA